MCRHRVFALQLVAGHLSKQEDVAGITLHFYDLTLPLISALLVLYRQKALPILGAFFLVCPLFLLFIFGVHANGSTAGCSH